MSARCDLEGHNILTLNLAHDIVTGKKTAEEARKPSAIMWWTMREVRSAHRQGGAGLGINVKAGENAGRKLLHDFVVLSFVKEPMTSGTAQLRLPSSTAPQANEPGKESRLGSPKPANSSPFRPSAAGSDNSVQERLRKGGSFGLHPIARFKTLEHLDDTSFRAENLQARFPDASKSPS